MKKETIVFALYVTSAIAVTAHAAVEIHKTFRKEKKETVVEETPKKAPAV